MSYFRSQLSFALLILAIPIYYSFAMKVFVLQFSAASVNDTLKIKMRSSDLPHPESRLLVGEAEEYLRAHCPADIDVDYFEFYNSKSERYEMLPPSEYMDDVGLYSVLVTTKSIEEAPLCIEGRAFDTSEGLFIDSRPLRIEEQVNRSEGTGLNTWDGSVVLAKYLEKHPELVRDKKVLEVGSGTGVTGLAASFLGASLSALTDLHYTLENLRQNLELNYPLMQEGSAVEEDSTLQDGRCVRHVPFVRPLDWTDSSTYLRPHDCQQRTNPDAERSDNNGGGVWDVILGADVVWLEQLVEPLVTALRAHCSPSTVILLSHQKRSEHTDSALFSYLREFFVVSKVDARDLNQEFSSPKINIFKCHLKESGA